MNDTERLDALISGIRLSREENSYRAIFWSITHMRQVWTASYFNARDAIDAALEQKICPSLLKSIEMNRR